MANDFKEKLHHPQKFEENILKAFEKRKLVFFIGAGVSRIMGVPGWNDFSALLIKQAFPDYKEHNIDINNNNLVFTASQYVKRYNNGDFLKFLRDIFRKDNIIIFVGYGLNEFELIDYIISQHTCKQKF